MGFYLNMINFPCKSAQLHCVVRCNYIFLTQLGPSFTLVSLGSSVNNFLDLIEEKQQISARIPKPVCFPLGMPSPLDRGAFHLQNQRASLFIHSYSYPGEKMEMIIKIYCLKYFPADDKCLVLNIANVTISSVNFFSPCFNNF